MAIAGGSGDYYLESVDAWYAVAVNSRTKECIVLGGMTVRSSVRAQMKPCCLAWIFGDNLSTLS